MELRVFLREAWKYVLLVILASVGSAALAFVISSVANSVYTAEAQVVVTVGLGTGATGIGSGDVLTAPRIGQTYATLALTRPVLLDVINRAKLPYNSAELARHLRVSADPISPFILITATDESPIRAETTANALADILIERATVPLTPNAPKQEVLAIIERAVVPEDPSGPRVLFNTVLAGATAFVLALTIVTLVAYVGGVRPVQQTTNG